MQTLTLLDLMEPPDRGGIKYAVRTIQALEIVSGRVPSVAFLTGMVVSYLCSQVQKGDLEIPDDEEFPPFIHEIVTLVKEALKT